VPWAARTVGRNGQVHPLAFVQQLPQGRHPAAVGRTANEFETHVVGHVRENLRVAVPAQQHRQVAVPPLAKGKRMYSCQKT